MSLDGAFLHIVTNELQPLIGARVDKVYQPSREEIVVSLRTFRDGGKKIVLSANSVSARLNLTAASFENPQQPPMFCMLLRKHLSGGKLMAIRQDGLERVISLDFECTPRTHSPNLRRLECAARSFSRTVHVRLVTRW